MNIDMIASTLGPILDKLVQKTNDIERLSILGNCFNKTKECLVKMKGSDSNNSQDRQIISILEKFGQLEMKLIEKLCD